MATNLISAVMQFLTPDLIAKIASSLGLDRGIAQKAIGAGVPAILAGLAGVASKPGGARQISDALTQSGTLDQLKNEIGGSGQSGLADSGSDLLSSLLGSGKMSALAGAISSFSGGDATKSKSLLGLLGPIVTGVLGQQQRNAGLTANGVADLLTSQQDQISAAMPSGFANLLSGSGLLGAGDNLRRGAEAAASRLSGVSSDVAQSGQAMYAGAAQRARSSSLPYWLAGLAAVLVLGWYFIGSHSDENLAEQLPAPTTRTDGTVGSGVPTISAAELTNQLTSSMGTVKTALQGITDSASAQAALPKLQQANAQLDRINGLAGQLPLTAKQGLASSVMAAMPAFNQLCDRILSTPAIAAVAKPTIDGLRARLEALSKA